MKIYFLKRYILKKISFRFCEKIFFKYIIFSIFWKDISRRFWKVFSKILTRTKKIPLRDHDSLDQNNSDHGRTHKTLDNGPDQTNAD